MTLIATCRCKPAGGTNKALLSDLKVSVGDAARGQRFDPTGTLDIRSQFRGDLDRRWSIMRRLVMEALDRNDVLGIGAGKNLFGLTAVAFLPINAPNKIEAFQRWIDEAMRQVVLGHDGSWMAKYIDQAHARANARSEQLTGQDIFVDDLVMNTMAALAVTELQGVIEVVSQRALRALADGHLMNHRASKVAREVALLVTSIGRKRSRDLANSVVVKTFSAATLAQFRAAGVTLVGTQAERIRVVKGPHGLTKASDAYDPNEERDDWGRWTSSGGSTFVSPNVGQMDFGMAQSEIGSARHQEAIKLIAGVDHDLGLDTKTTSVIGAWADGAEDSTMGVTRGASWDQLKTAAAMKGWITNQKQVLVFQRGHGTDFIASFRAKGTTRQIHDRMLAKGLQFHTIEPGAGGASTVHVFGQDAETVNYVRKAAYDEGSKPKIALGRGEFVGTQKTDGTDAEQRADARSVYESAIRSSGVRGASAGWDRIRSHRPAASDQASVGDAYDPDQARDDKGKWTATGIAGMSDVRGPSDDVGEVLSAMYLHGAAIGRETVPIGHLKTTISAGDNPARIDALAAQISAQGGYFSRPIVDDEGNVVEGQHRVAALRKLGAKHVPIYRVKDLARGMPVGDMEKAIRAVGGIHPDHVNQIVTQVLEMIHEVGTPAKVLEEFEFPRQFDKQFRAALHAAARGKTGDAFDPDQPRDPHSGEWTVGGSASGVFSGKDLTFHGSAASVLASVRKNGLKVGKDKHVYTANQLSTAEMYASGKARETGATPIIFAVRIPKEHAADFSVSFKHQKLTVFASDKNIPQEYIVGYREVGKDGKLGELKRLKDAEPDEDLELHVVVFADATAADSFNPDEPRDDHGRWTAGGDAGTAAAYKESSLGMNEWLRGDRSGGSATTSVAAIKAMDDLIDAHTLPADLVLYRGSNYNAYSTPAQLRDKGFLSTSSDEMIARDFVDPSEPYPFVVAIHVKAGQRAYTFKNDPQLEVVLPRGTVLKPFKVVRSEPIPIIHVTAESPRRRPSIDADSVGVNVTDARGAVYGGRCRVADARRGKAPGRTKQRQIERQHEALQAIGEVDVLTAGDEDVCQVCEDISNDGPYDIDDALGLIPAHPNCRCAFVPVSDERFAEIERDAA